MKTFRNFVGRYDVVLKQLHICSQQPSSSLILSRFVSTVSNVHQFTVDYLINSCGLSPESALKASNKIALKSTTGPDSVLALFKTYGFAQSHITTLITKSPDYLLARPGKTIKPKLEYFHNIGIAGPSLGKLISSHPKILRNSLQKQIIPSVTFLKSLVLTDTSFYVVLTRSKWVLNNAECAMGPNIKTLQDIGVPQSNIAKFVILFPQGLYRRSDVFRKAVMQVEEMGVCPSKMTFLLCVHALLCQKKSTWDAKMNAYHSFGWSKDEVLCMFKMQPGVMSISVEKIKLALDFLTNGQKWSRGDIIKNACVILYSLKNRVIPRCHILQILLSKGLVKKITVGQPLRLTEDVFLKKYVTKYHHQVPELLIIYQTKMNNRRVLNGSKDGCRMKEV